MNEWRDAWQVELHDCNTRLGVHDGGEGVFSASGTDVWRLDGKVLVNLFDSLGLAMDLQRFAKLGRSAEDEDHVALRLERVPIVPGRSWYGYYDGNQFADRPGRIEARILAANLLDLRLHFGAGTDKPFVQHATYSGAFTVEWATEGA